MFDDLSKNPLSEKINNSTDQAVQKNNLTPIEPPDIFATTDNVVDNSLPKPPIFQPKKLGENEIESLNIISEAEVQGSGKGRKQKYVIAGSIVGFMILFFFALWYSYNILLPKLDEKKVKTPVTKEQAKSNGNIGDSENVAPVQAPNGEPDQPTKKETEVVNPEFASTTPETAASNNADNDSDGLTNDEEKASGSDINDSDTDHDGLFDREEVKIYHTSLLDPDTDHDGFTDGTEVKNGFNPVGEGKLYDINKNQ